MSVEHFELDPETYETQRKDVLKTVNILLTYDPNVAMGIIFQLYCNILFISCGLMPNQHEELYEVIQTTLEDFTQIQIDRIIEVTK